MRYNFNDISQIRGTHSRKWDVKDNELPMWVADMDFKVLPEIKEAIINAVNIESLGYVYPTENFFKAYQLWWKKRHNLDLKLEEIVYVSGVISALDCLINHLTNKGDAVMILNPSYSGFFSVVNNNKRKLVTSDLIYQNDDFVIDYDDVEKQIIDNDVKAIIFCNPHNPTGKLWSKEEIKAIYDVCKKHNVIFISDEIHCDIVDPGYSYVPALTVADDVITCIAPSKVFNLAGLQSAVCVIKDEKIRKYMQASFYHDDVGEPNFFVEPATVAAYTYGGDYVDELNAYLLKNKQYVREFINKELPHLKVTSGVATYLLWIDVSYYQIPGRKFAHDLRKETGLFVSEGPNFGTEGENYIRMNVATSLANVKDGLNRLKEFLKNKEK